MQLSRNLNYLLDYSISKRLGLDNLRRVEHTQIVNELFSILYNSIDMHLHQQIKIRLKKDVHVKAN